MVSSGFSLQQYQGKSSHAQKSTAREVGVLQGGDLPSLALCSILFFQARVCPPGLKNPVALTFFYLNLFIFGLRVSEEVPVKLSAKWSSPENLIS